MKIAIVGNAGSGKSTLALQLHKLLHLPLYHLDQHFWKPGWVEPDRSEFEKVHNALCEKPTWIIEGMAIRFFEYRMLNADVVIFIDTSRTLSLYRVCRRAFKSFGKEFFSSAPGCPERFPSLKFLRFIWNFPNQQKKHINLLLEKYAGKKKIFVVENKQEVQKLVEYFKMH